MHWLNTDPISFGNKIRAYHINVEQIRREFYILLKEWSQTSVILVINYLKQKGFVPKSAIIQSVSYIGLKHTVEFIMLDDSFEPVIPGYSAPIIQVDLNAKPKLKN